MIDTTRNGRVLHLTLNSPPVNVVGREMLEELTAALSELEDDVAAVVLSGDGKCFSAGASVEEHKPDQAAGMLKALANACAAVHDAPAPVVALVQGFCLGGAMELVSFCDFVVADPGAKFGQPEIKLAFFPPLGCYQLARLGGMQNAAYTVLTGENLTAEQALGFGFVQKILPQNDWGEIDKLFNGLSSPVVRLTKRAFRKATSEIDRQRMDEMNRLFVDELYKIDDVAEGIASFGERRKPEWKHK
ncbi:MAG: enoyl-CoA hydratase/isomerase family protein [bacterium]|nr:enoyl-CoA hydratase/isomerase family protein [bacterium]